jgi:iron(III) transport system ATP-binding protein
MATLELKSLTKSYDGMVPALDGVSLQLKHGELVALLGPSGCGKTTTLRLVAGFIEPDAGTIEVGGEVIASPNFSLPPERRRMSMIFQSYAIWPHKTIYENVVYGLKYRNVPRSERDEKVRKMLGVVKLDRYADRYPGELSGGQQQRVALARALVVEPEILLLDEPLSNLDANLREEMRFEIRRLHDEFHFTSIYVTHDQSEAMVIADRICVMNQGRVEQLGTPTEIYERPRTRFVAGFVGKTNLLSGRLVSSDRFDLGGGITLPVRPQPEIAAGNGNGVSVSLRPHDVILRQPGPNGADGDIDGYQRFSGKVEESFYFGELLDYQVRIGDGCILRVITPPGRPFASGSDVNVFIHPEHCVLVCES